MKTLIPALLLLSMTAACNSVSGTLDGQDATATNAFYIQNDEAFGNDALITVYISDVPEACVAYENYLEDIADALTSFSAEEAVDAFQDNLPEEFWLTTVSFRVDDLDDELGGMEFKGTDYDEGLADDDEVKVITEFHNRYPEEDDFALFGEWDYDYMDVYRSDEGAGKISGYVADESIRGKFTGLFVDTDEDDVGELKVSFNAKRCRGVEREIW